MPLLKLTGATSVLRLHLEHPIHLDEKVDYRLALVGFYSDNNIYNMLEDGNLRLWSGNIMKTLTLHSGYWTIGTLQLTVREFIAALKRTDVDAATFKIMKNGDRIAIHSPVKFYMDAALCNLLGFDPSDKTSKDSLMFYEAATTVTAQNPPNLRVPDVIEIHCDLTENSLVQHLEHAYKHAETSILYTFYSNAPHGYKISQVPHERHYVKVKSGIRKIQQVTISIMDNKNRLLQNEGVNNIVYLDLVAQ